MLDGIEVASGDSALVGSDRILNGQLDVLDRIFRVVLELVFFRARIVAVVVSLLEDVGT